MEATATMSASRASSSRRVPAPRARTGPNRAWWVGAAWLRAPLVALALLAMGGGQVRADEEEPVDVPPELEGITIVENIDAQLPLDAWFTDSSGRHVQLKQYFHRDKPVILTLNYYRCPMLCSLLLNGMIDALREVGLDVEQDYTLVTVSFDPLEDVKIAEAKKRNYVRDWGHPKAALGWHFLVGQSDAIKQLTRTVGFRFRWNAERNEWAHPSALILCTPEGRVARYLGGVMFDPKVLRLSLVEASQGKIGGLADQIYLTCFQWTDSHGRYTPYVMGMVRLAGGLTLAVMAVMIVSLWRIEAGRRRRARSGAAAPAG